MSRVALACAIAALAAGCVAEPGRGWVEVAGVITFEVTAPPATLTSVDRLILDVEGVAFVGVGADTSAGGPAHDHGGATEAGPGEHVVLAESELRAELELVRPGTFRSVQLLLMPVDLPLGELHAIEVHLERLEVAGSVGGGAFAFDVPAEILLTRELPEHFESSRAAPAQVTAFGSVVIDGAALLAAVPAGGTPGRTITDPMDPAAAAVLAVLQDAGVDLSVRGPID